MDLEAHTEGSGSFETQSVRLLKRQTLFRSTSVRIALITFVVANIIVGIGSAAADEHQSAPAWAVMFGMIPGSIAMICLVVAIPLHVLMMFLAKARSISLHGDFIQIDYGKGRVESIPASAVVIGAIAVPTLLFIPMGANVNLYVPQAGVQLDFSTAATQKATIKQLFLPSIKYGGKKRMWHALEALRRAGVRQIDR